MEKAVLRLRLGTLVGLDVVFQRDERNLLLVVVERGVLQHRTVAQLELDQARQLHAFLATQLDQPIALPGDVSADE